MTEVLAAGLPWEGSLGDAGLWLALLALLAVGVGAGIVDATTGGGGMLQIPALFALAGPGAGAVAPIMALNKVSAAVGNAVSFTRFRRTEGVASPDRRTTAVALGAGLPGVIAGVWLASRLDTDQFTPLLVASLVVVLAYVLLIQPRVRVPERAGAPTAGVLAGMAGGVIVLGFYDGLLGPATGSILILVMQFVLGAGLRTGLATAKLVQLLFNLTGAISYALVAMPALAAVVALSAGNAVGGWLGTRIVARIDDRVLRLLVAAGVAGAIVLTVTTH